MPRMDLTSQNSTDDAPKCARSPNSSEVGEESHHGLMNAQVPASADDSADAAAGATAEKIEMPISSTLQQSRLMEALGSQLYLLADAVVAAGKNESPMDVARGLEETTAYMRQVRGKGPCHPEPLSHVPHATLPPRFQRDDSLQPTRTQVDVFQAYASKQVDVFQGSALESAVAIATESAPMTDCSQRMTFTSRLTAAERGDKWLRENLEKHNRKVNRLSQDHVDDHYDFEDTSGDPIGSCKQLLAQIYLHPYFEPGLGLIIIANSVTIGVDTELNHRGIKPPFFMDVLEFVFFFIYLFELLGHIWVFGRRCLNSSWVQFDAFIVCAMFLEMVANMLPKLGSAASGILDSIAVVRLCRIARLARVVRLLGRFKMLWLLVQGLLASGRCLFWILMVIFVMVYIFTILGMEIIKPDPDASDHYNATIDYFFGDMQRTMLTIFLLGLCMDDIGPIYRGLALEQPILFIYFLLLFMVVSIALLNLTMALMVESALEQAAAVGESKKLQELEEKHEKILELAGLFEQLDIDSSGFVDKSELISADADMLDRMGELIGTDDPDEIVRIFEILDYDDTGRLTYGEFCSGLMQQISGMPLELNMLLKQCKDIRLYVTPPTTSAEFLQPQSQLARPMSRQVSPASSKDSPRVPDQWRQKPKQSEEEMVPRDVPTLSRGDDYDM